MEKVMSITKLIDGYKKKEFSPVEITKQYLKRMDDIDHKLHAFITITYETALAQAKNAEDNYLKGKQLSALQGVPLSYKDLINTNGVRTTSGSKIKHSYIPNSDAYVVQKLTQAGAIDLGKTNLHEFAFGITSTNPFYGAVKNPWNPDNIPGGSSGGSGAAVCANLGLASIGTDTGGSIRIPASACGVIGLKPTKGMVDTTGVQGISWTLDHVGPITQNIGDLAIIMNGLTDRLYQEHCHTQISGMRIGVPRHYFTYHIEPDILLAYQNALRQLESLGAILMEIDISSVQTASEQVFPIALAEGASIHENHLRFKLNDFGEDVRAHLEAGKSITAMDYIKALNWRKKAISEVDQALTEVDIIATPTLPVSPKQIGVEHVEIDDLQEDIFTSMTRYTRLFSLTGHPALSIPMGLDTQGMPMGLQLASKYYYEPLLIRSGYAFEQSYLTDFYEQRQRISQNL
ncbi:amidase [Virgibacillus pantothenticus]|uniref:amidase n=1 Tax=Virgibacillus pantothenticus TaxID=1473 RepID=UPI0025B0FF4B|nr:amidase [Virgibacillus pantothenticus]